MSRSIYETILLDKEDRVSTITLNRPEKMNACNITMWQDIESVLTEIELDSNIRVVVLTGQGKAFSAGEDVSILEFDKGIIHGVNFSKMVNSIFTHFERMPQTVIAAVNGYAFGFGISVLLYCDIVIASDKATFGWKEIDHGLMPPEALLWGVDIMGKRNIAYLTLTGETFTANEAKVMGLVNRVVPHKQLMVEVYKICDGLKNGAPLAQQYVKRIINRKSQEYADYCTAVMPTILATDDAAEGRRAFMEKRKPIYKGK